MKILYGLRVSEDTPDAIDTAAVLVPELRHCGAKVEFFISGTPIDSLPSELLHLIGDAPYQVHTSNSNSINNNNNEGGATYDGHDIVMEDNRHDNNNNNSNDDHNTAANAAAVAAATATAAAAAATTIAKFGKAKLEQSMSLARQVKGLSVDEYDLILTDQEPISAWAGTLKRKKVIALSQQYADMVPSVPRGQDTTTTSLVSARWARFCRTKTTPNDICLGFHCYHFDYPKYQRKLGNHYALLPPLTTQASPKSQCDADPSNDTEDNCNGKFLVYLPDELLEDIQTILGHFQDHEFIVFHTPKQDLLSVEEEQPRSNGNIEFRTMTSRSLLTRELSSCAGLICNGDFTLLCEALQLGKKVLIKLSSLSPTPSSSPQHRRQVSHALAFQKLELAFVMHGNWDMSLLSRWMDVVPSFAWKLSYPRTAKILADWLVSGDWGDVKDLARGLWRVSFFLEQNQQLTCPMELKK